MSRFKTAAIAPSFHNGIVFKRKGARVRYIDPATAKVSGWMRDPNATVTDAPSERALAHSVLKDMTVAELRDLAKGRGVKVPSKARKADIISALTETR